jgi:purine-binding chemotaxis protein CheW
VVLLNRECFGVPLALVVEFTDALKFTPLPSCPDHVTGVTNLRGEILTLVDIRPVLRMPLASPGGSSQVMVVEVGDIRAGILVDQVLDITYFRPADVIPLPSAVKSANEESVEGTILYRERVLSVLSIPRIFARQDWIVNQAA